ncbi:MAG: aspartyl-phosphate phosphatase Spo0E family protein [Clostridiales bacterium]|nr:aspartyl-phosphate phosphatase Spo0E family protein [Eubacteriales bacterium]MDH7565980.1 aspartyl-phosphate phosphatase Spo0E family protein [Clostridiales bacterium]
MRNIQKTSKKTFEKTSVLKNKIDKLRDKLNTALDSGIENSEQILSLSRELDELIIEYYNSQNERRKLTSTSKSVR